MQRKSTDDSPRPNLDLSRLASLATEQASAFFQELDRFSTGDLLRLMNAADQEIATLVAAQIPRIEAATDAIATVLENGGSLFYIGAGTSGRLGVLDAAECPPTFGVSPELVRGIIAGGEQALVRSVEGAEDDADQGAADLLGAGFRSCDAVVGIAASGRTPYVLGAINEASRLGAVTCGISCVADSDLSRAVRYPIDVVTGAEVLTGSTRLRAGTATKMVLNMISTAVMVGLGHVYGNLMVNVQPTNQKLVDRARRIIAQVASVDVQRAAELLDEAGGNVKVAIVMGRKNVDRSTAERLLEQANGWLRRLIE